MRRVPGLVELSRRGFCAVAGLTLVGCTDGGLGAVQTGALGAGDDTAPPVDAPGTTATDGGTTSDASMGAVCTGSPIDVGAPSTFTANTPVYISNGKFFVVRDAGGLYALTSLCTHEGAICSVSSGKFRCPRHGALFTFAGAVVSGPVSKALVHYSMCTMANGHVGVNTSSIVPATTRLSA
jgi:cytochrome b6-f complex iron-sulfur subunit